MDDFVRFQKLAACSGIVLTVATVLNVITLFASVDNDASALFSDPTPLLLIGSTGANWFHWSMVFDLFGYLSFVPIALLGYKWFREKGPNIVLLYSLCGVLYSVIGSIGAVSLGVVVPTLVDPVSSCDTEPARSHACDYQCLL